MRLQNGFNFLRKRLYENAASQILITRDDKVLGYYDAIFARTKFEDVDGANKRVIMFVFDFIVRGDSGYSPQNGDRVVYDNRVFVVRPINKELWRFDDPYETMIRVHTREEAQV